jgi:diguanylate cyclase (GGDEF)-like protein
MDTKDKGRKMNKRIAVVTNGWSAEFLAMVIESMRKRAERDGVDIFVFNSYILWHDSDKRRKRHLKLFSLIKPEDYDGAVIFANTFNTQKEADTAISVFKNSNIPVVTTEIKIPGMAFVGSRNYKGMHELTTHLIEKHNVKKIIYMSGIKDNVECAERRRAVEDALGEHGLSLTDSLRGDFDFYTAHEVIGEWLETDAPLPDAFVCANDLMALGVINRLHKAGIEVPSDVLVTGFDYIKEAKLSYPLQATVSRQWDVMGEYVYDELMRQIDDPDPDREVFLDSTFVPAESCGCESDEASKAMRLEKIRNMYPDSIRSDMIDLFLQKVRREMDKVENRADFYKDASLTFGKFEFFGPNFCICTNPLFFEEDPDEYMKKVKDFSDTIDVVYEKRNGKSISGGLIESRSIYPGYKKKEGESNLYIICVLNSAEYLIGYIAIKNSPESLYNLQLKRLVNNMELLFVTIKNYIFSQKNYRELHTIYMTDSLSGLYNRTGCDKVLAPFVESRKEKGKKSILLFFDINNMKLINDEYGHLNGDLAIKATAEAMRSTLSDGKWLLARYGGDEFVAVGKYNRPFSIAAFRKKFEQALKPDNTGLKTAFELSASVGYCIISPDDQGTIDEYIHTADKSMYEHKEKMRNAGKKLD